MPRRTGGREVKVLRRFATLLLLVLLVASAPALAQDEDTEALLARIEALEARVAELEARLSVPPPPPTSHEAEGFLFQRISYRQSSPRYVEVVGEVSGPSSYVAVTFRVTLYGEDGSILATDTVLVEGVTSTPKPFSLLLRDVDASAVHSARLTVERAR